MCIKDVRTGKLSRLRAMYILTRSNKYTSQLSGHTGSLTGRLLRYFWKCNENITTH